jgi:heme-degrading monooxygenase HmoA
MKTTRDFGLVWQENTGPQGGAMTADGKIRWGYLIVWEFRPRSGVEKHFEEAYGPNGVWAEFFAKGEGFIATELNRDLKDARRYLTLDLWVSREAHERFLGKHSGEYRALDRQCEGLTEQETELGRFERLGC